MLMMPLALLLSSPLAALPAPNPAQPSLVAAEYAFAEKASAQGIRTAFMEYLRPDSLVFIPKAVNGHDYYRTQLEIGAKLDWSPVVAEVSLAGDLGFTSSPFTWRAGKDEPIGAFGWSVTLWQREGSNPWKARLDIGIPTPDPSDNPAPVLLPKPQGAALLPVFPGQGNPAELAAVDAAFAKEAGDAKGMDIVAVYKKYVTSDVRFYRKGHFPVEGDKSLNRALDAGKVTWSNEATFVAASNDLACTHGKLFHDDGTAKTTSNFVRMWKKVGGTWKIALDLELELPVKK